MATHRATAALADTISTRLLRLWPTPKGASWEEVREACDLETMGEFPAGELDKLADMVYRRLRGAA